MAKDKGVVARLLERGRGWLDVHNAIACAGLALLCAAVVVGLYLFVTLSDFGGSADFIYNQF